MFKVQFREAGTMKLYFISFTKEEHMLAYYNSLGSELVRYKAMIRPPWACK